MIEPVRLALTTSIRPACSAKNAMISSAMLPNVALRMPPTCGPVISPSRSVAWPIDPREPEDRQGRAGRRRPSAASDRDDDVGDDRPTARTATTTSDDPRATGDMAPRIGTGDPLRAAGGHGRCSPSARAPVQPASRDAARGRDVGGPRRRGPRRAATSRSTSASAARREASVVSARRLGGRSAATRRRRRSTNSPRGVRLPVPCPVGELAERRRGRSPRGASSARGRSPRALAAAGRREVGERRRDPPGRLVQHRARSSAAIRAIRSRRSRPERGRNPSNDQRGPATADAATAASTADGARDRDDRPALRRPTPRRARRPDR